MTIIPVGKCSNFPCTPDLIVRFCGPPSRHYNAQKAWNQTIEEIRQKPGLESFLLPSPFERLQEAASEGPVIIVNINGRRSDAIIIHSEGEPVLVPLPEASPEAVREIIDGFGKRPAECETRKAISLLQEIWAIIVELVVAQLLQAPTFAGPDRPRIWWCPTGIASKLPLHAAGPYKRGEKNLGHIFISSYTPTLSTLIRARQARGDIPTTRESARSILIVGQPDTPEENPLPQVVDEVLAIKGHVPHASLLLSLDGTKEAVLSGLCQNAWLHLACHGHYDTKQPFHSSFSMYDGRITLLELIGRDLPHAELAFLSACHSARASETLPDEALHPAAGMMFTGFKSVIGTMWAFDDGVGSALAGRFYKLMVEGKKGYADAAVVLADAIQDIVDKDRDAVPFMQRINVVHYGV